VALAEGGVASADLGRLSLVLRQGPIPHFVHGVIEYLAGVFLIVAPFLLSYDDGAAVAVSIVAGVAVLLIASATEGPTSLINSIPLPVHVVLDYGLAALLVATPFLFGFSGEGAPTAAFIALGVAHLLVTVGTRFRTSP
jgi:hypothetical protein